MGTAAVDRDEERAATTRSDAGTQVAPGEDAQGCNGQGEDGAGAAHQGRQATVRTTGDDSGASDQADQERAGV